MYILLIKEIAAGLVNVCGRFKKTFCKKDRLKNNHIYADIFS